VKYKVAMVTTQSGDINACFNVTTARIHSTNMHTL